MSEEDFPKLISAYRDSLLTMEQKMQGDYDKAVMTLSGGALGVSFTFLKEVVRQAGISSPSYLLAAWICWGASATCTLFSFYTSALALRRAISQTDDKLIYLELIGGRYTTITKILNFSGGALFLMGVVSVVIFVARNLH
jgi:hypothetical protein